MTAGQKENSRHLHKLRSQLRPQLLHVLASFWTEV